MLGFLKKVKYGLLHQDTTHDRTKTHENNAIEINERNQFTLSIEAKFKIEKLSAKTKTL